MTNLGAGFPMGSPEVIGPPPQSSSGPPSERDRYTDFQNKIFIAFKRQLTKLTRPFSLSFSSRHLMPPPLLPVNGVRPKMEERRAMHGFVGKGINLWTDTPLPKSKAAVPYCGLCPLEAQPRSIHSSNVEL